MLKVRMVKRFAAATVVAAAVAVAVPGQALAAVDLSGTCTLSISGFGAVDPVMTVTCNLSNPQAGIRDLRIMADDTWFDNGIQQCPGGDQKVWKRLLPGHMLNEDRYPDYTEDDIYVKVRVGVSVGIGAAVSREIKTNTEHGFWGEGLVIGGSSCGTPV